MDIHLVQKLIKEEALDGWLIYDFRGINEIARDLLKEAPGLLSLTRRFFYWLPRSGDPVVIVHSIEVSHVKGLKGQLKTYSSFEALKQVLKETLSNCKTIAMEYSPMGALPYLSFVDGGTLDLIQSLGPEVVSSSNLLAGQISRWNQLKLNSHLKAARALEEEVYLIFDWVHQNLKASRSFTEYDVQQKLKERLCKRGMYLDQDPIVGIDAHSADPHYSPSQDSAAEIQFGQFLLIDAWCRLEGEETVYADICRVATLKDAPSPKEEEVFQVVLEAQEKVIKTLNERAKEKREVLGYELDDLARNHIKECGYGKFFTHRTGHNIDRLDHGSGTHLDHYETQDTRRIWSNTCFSIEPAVYLAGEFGIRIESDIYVDSQMNPHVTGGQQKALICLGPNTEYEPPKIESPTKLSV